jgi:hypothetical protein
MDPATMSDEEKKTAMVRAAKSCNFFCLFLACTAAMSCGLAATGWCAFVTRDVQIDYSQVPAICEQYGATAAQCETIAGGPVGVGFYGWLGTVPVDQPVCFSYTQWIEGVGWVTPTFDTKYNSARAFTYVADFFGLLAFFTLAFASCCPLDPAKMAGLSCYFFIAMLFQGLSLLIFQSNICDAGFFASYFQAYPEVQALINEAEVTCGLARGGKLAVAATVLYFWCMLTAPGAFPPTPIGGNPFEQGQQAAPQQEEAAPQQEDTPEVSP